MVPRPSNGTGSFNGTFSLLFTASYKNAELQLPAEIDASLKTNPPLCLAADGNTEVSGAGGFKKNVPFVTSQMDDFHIEKVRR